MNNKNVRVDKMEGSNHKVKSFVINFNNNIIWKEILKFPDSKSTVPHKHLRTRGKHQVYNRG